MGRFIDLDSPLSQDDKDYLVRRGRGYLIPANERRFGVDGTQEPAEHEKAGEPISSPFYDADERAAAVYDTGGSPLPGTTLDYDTGRVLDRDNGVAVEPQPAGHTPGAHPSPWPGGEYDEYDSDIDDDIAEEVTALKVAELKARLKEEGVEFESSDKKEDLQDKLAIFLQDQRNSQ